MNPSVVLELTATPIKGENNVIYQVSAWELKAENMIKLPIILGEFTVGWERCLDESIKIRNSLEADTAYESLKEYIRPIVLIQAQRKGLEPSPESVKNYLMETLSIPEEEIAIATGTQKDLKDVNLFDRDCSIRYVITIQALKEGWDCSFAYVLCSLQNIQSSKDTEQLLGRVLRMPYAKKRVKESLNRSYANVVSEKTWDAAQRLKDGLVENLGFDQIAADALIETENEIPTTPSLFPNFVPAPDQPNKKPVTVVFTTDVNPTTAIEESGLRDFVSVAEAKRDGHAILVVRPDVDSEKLRALEQKLSTKQPKASRENNHNVLAGLFMKLSRQAAKDNQRSPFPEMPRLCCVIDGEVYLLTDETVMSQPWNPLEFSHELQFHPVENAARFVIDSQQGTHVLVHEQIQDTELPFSYTQIETSPDALIRWVTDQVARKDVLKNVMLKFVDVVIRSTLTGSQGLSLDKLYAHKVELARAIKDLLRRNYTRAIQIGFNCCLDNFATITDLSALPSSYVYKFDPTKYRPRRVYDLTKGGRRFEKHMTEAIHDLQFKTDKGKITEEYRCAEAIETNKDVVRWIRNIDGSPDSFFLATPTGNFYPDFFAELSNGKVLVIEYKGEALVSNDDSRMKRCVGETWEKGSGGRCFFLMAVKEDEQGRNVNAQIQAKINQALIS